MILLCSVFTSFFMSSIDSVSNHINFPKTIDTGTTNFTTPLATSLMLIVSDEYDYVHDLQGTSN